MAKASPERREQAVDIPAQNSRDPNLLRLQVQQAREGDPIIDRADAVARQRTTEVAERHGLKPPEDNSVAETDRVAREGVKARTGEYAEKCDVSVRSAEMTRKAMAEMKGVLGELDQEIQNALTMGKVAVAGSVLNTDGSLDLGDIAKFFAGGKLDSSLEKIEELQGRLQKFGKNTTGLNHFSSRADLKWGVRAGVLGALGGGAALLGPAGMVVAVPTLCAAAVAGIVSQVKKWTTGFDLIKNQTQLQTLQVEVKQLMSQMDGAQADLGGFVENAQADVLEQVNAAT